MWDRELVDEGISLISGPFSQSAIGPYRLQAAIAALHDEARNVEDTDWRQIFALYGLLEKLTENPMVSLNRAIAASMASGPATGLEMLNTLDSDPRLTGHYRLDAVRGHLYERLGDSDHAVAHYRAAAERTASIPERDYLNIKAARLVTKG